MVETTKCWTCKRQSNKLLLVITLINSSNSATLTLFLICTVGLLITYKNHFIIFYNQWSRRPESMQAWVRRFFDVKVACLRRAELEQKSISEKYSRDERWKTCMVGWPLSEHYYLWRNFRVNILTAQSRRIKITQYFTMEDSLTLFWSPSWSKIFATSFPFFLIERRHFFMSWVQQLMRKR